MHQHSAKFSAPSLDRADCYLACSRSTLSLDNETVYSPPCITNSIINLPNSNQCTVDHWVGQYVPAASASRAACYFLQMHAGRLALQVACSAPVSCLLPPLPPAAAPPPTAGPAAAPAQAGSASSPTPCTATRENSTAQVQQKASSPLPSTFIHLEPLAKQHLLCWHNKIAGSTARPLAITEQTHHC